MGGGYPLPHPPRVQGVANKLFRNESYITKKFNISAFQNCFSYFH